MVSICALGSEKSNFQKLFQEFLFNMLSMILMQLHEMNLCFFKFKVFSKKIKLNLHISQNNHILIRFTKFFKTKLLKETSRLYYAHDHVSVNKTSLQFTFDHIIFIRQPNLYIDIVLTD